MLVLLIFAVWFTPGLPDVTRAYPLDTLEACEVAKAEVVAKAAEQGHKVDARCIVLKPGIPA